MLYMRGNDPWMMNDSLIREGEKKMGCWVFLRDRIKVQVDLTHITHKLNLNICIKSIR
jgi:hypothetical protein